MTRIHSKENSSYIFWYEIEQRELNKFTQEGKGDENCGEIDRLNAYYNIIL